MKNGISRRDLFKGLGAACAVAGIKEVRTGTIEPDDLVVFKTDFPITREAAERIKTEAKQLFGPKQKIIVLTAGVEMELLKRGIISTNKARQLL